MPAKSPQVCSAVGLESCSKVLAAKDRLHTAATKHLGEPPASKQNRRRMLSRKSSASSFHFLLRDKPSIHHQRCAGGKFCIVGTEIENCCGDLFASANSRHGNDRSDLVAQFISGKPIPHLGGDHTRSDSIDANVLFGELERDAFV